MALMEEDQAYIGQGLHHEDGDGEVVIGKTFCHLDGRFQVTHPWRWQEHQPRCLGHPCLTWACLRVGLHDGVGKDPTLPYKRVELRGHCLQSARFL